MTYRKREPGIRPTKNGWCVDARIRVNGKIVHRRRTLEGTKERAREVLAEMKREIRGAKSAECSLTVLATFSDVLSIYREKKNKHLAPDISRIDKLSADLGKVPLAAFPDRFEAYLKLYRSSPLAKYNDTVKKGKLPSNATVNRLIEMVRASFTLAVELELLKVNPITKARFPKAKESPRNRYLNEDERRRLLNVIEARAPYLLPIVRYSLLVPCRKGELVKLPREAYNAFTNQIFVPDSKAGISINKPVPPEMKDYFIKGIPAGCPWLFFRQEKDGFHSLGDFKKAFRSCVKAAGLQNVRVHDLRHVAASDLCALGNSEREIMDIAGWKTPMLSTYWHKDSMRSAANIKFSSKCEHAVNNESAAAI